MQNQDFILVAKPFAIIPKQNDPTTSVKLFPNSKDVLLVGPSPENHLELSVRY